ncbi:MAG: aromatic ring-hydroxylating dioxygenase subunit alpha [Chloroflexota bacterium]|nr:aromatic ring-hydroxylating dioxygenase subunit alpha [Chloroflexota bacterium]
MSTETAQTGAALERSLPRASYVSPEVYERERERIFFREWFCAGRTEEIPLAGDYLVRDVLGESVLIVHARDGALRAFYNVCRHRGCRLVLDDAPAPRPDAPPCADGRFRGAIRCPYHSWTYGLDGALRNAPFLHETEQLTKADFSLHPVALDVWGGFIFVNLAADDVTAAGRTLADQLAAIPDRFARYGLANLRIAQRLVYEVQANWKVIMENYNECYHCGGVHPELCEVVPAFRQNGGGSLDWEHGIPHRDGAFTFTRSGTTNRAPLPDLNEHEQTRHFGEIAYPNMLMSFAADHVAAFTLWPRDPQHTTVVCDFLFDRTEIERSDFDPSDAVEFWDLINRQDWTICAGVQRGMSSRSFQVGYYAPMEDDSLDIRRYVTARLEEQ